MKYPASLYAKVLAAAADSLRSGKDNAREAQIVKNFLALVRRNNDDRHLRKILEEAERLTVRKSGMRKVRIESARAPGMAAEKMINGFLRPKDIVDRKIAPELIAGIKIILNGELQFDGSLKGKLDVMFKNI